jgi:hypothetical protein
MENDSQLNTYNGIALSIVGKRFLEIVSKEVDC